MNIFEHVQATVSGSKADVSVIGKSVCGRDILCAHCGSYLPPQIIVTAAIHARECYTALVVLEQIDKFCGTHGGAYFIPLVNPDGALFFEQGIARGSETLESFISSHRYWKANANGVDLNCNFDANWGSGAQNKRYVAPSDYIGASPQSEPESRALVEFTRKVMPAATVSYHCMGGELYWEFFQKATARKRDCRLAKLIANRIDVKKVDGHLNSAGGYKDYCVMRLGIPAFTIELIKKGDHPFSPSDFAEDIAKNADLPRFILDILR